MLHGRAVQQASALAEEGFPRQYQGAFEPAPSTPTRARSAACAASASAPGPRGPRELVQKTKTMKDLCMSPDSDAGAVQLPVSCSAGGKASKRGVAMPRAGAGVRVTASASTVVKREASPDISAEVAAAALVAASKRRRFDVKAATATEQRQRQPDNDARAADAEPDSHTPLPDSKNTEAPNGMRQRGSAGSKELQRLASKVFVTPGQTRTRRNASDQAWWVVK